MQRFPVKALRDLNPRGCALIATLHAGAEADLLAQATAVRGVADAVELRLDFLDFPLEFVSTLGEPGGSNLITRLREAAAAPVLGTLRTTEQGGGAEIDFLAYAEAVTDLARHCEYVDLQWDRDLPAPILQGLLEGVRSGGAAEVLSWHDFAQMPPLAVLDEFFTAAKSAGAMVAKLAVRPDTRAQVAQLLQLLARHTQPPQVSSGTVLQLSPKSETEFVAVAMGQLGRPSRIAAPLFGAAATFSSAQDFAAGEDSAAGGDLGQLPATAMARALDALAEAGINPGQNRPIS